MKTIEQHRRDGTYRADRHSGLEPDVAIPAAPGGLSDGARDIFERTAHLLASEGAICRLDSLALGQLAQLAADIAMLQEDIQQNGFTEATTKGNVVQRPEVGALNQCRGHFLKLLTQFGLTPSGRRGLPVKKDEDDALVRMLRLFHAG